MGSGGGTDQHYCLRWNNFHSNIATSFEELRDHEDFVDVTLSCEGQTIKAHKVVLSACSPYFRSLLKQNPCQHPIIILRDVSYDDVCALLNFVYQGEVYVSQDRLTGFLRTAEHLQIKGLTEEEQQHSSHAVSQGGTGLAVSLLPLHNSGGASAVPLTHLVATAPQQPVISEQHQQNPHHDARGVPLSPSPTRPHCSPSPPPPPLPYVHPPTSKLHISPPPKKRKHITSPLSSNSSTSSCEPLPPSPSDMPPTSVPLIAPKLEPGGNIGGSTLAAALTAPREPPPPSMIPSMVEVKQETIDSPHMDDTSNSSGGEAVNLVMDGNSCGSILRQRIQGFQGSPDAPLPTSYLPSKEDEEEGSPSTQAIIRRQRQMLGFAAAAAAAGVYSSGGANGGREVSCGGDPTVQSAQEDNPYEARPCPVCHKSISNRANLKKHLKIRHSQQEEATCPHCQKPFRNKYSLWTHVNSYHPHAKATQHLLPPPPIPPPHHPSLLSAPSSSSSTTSNFAKSHPMQHQSVLVSGSSPSHIIPLKAQHYDSQSYSTLPSSRGRRHSSGGSDEPLYSYPPLPPQSMEERISPPQRAHYMHCSSSLPRQPLPTSRHSTKDDEHYSPAGPSHRPSTD